MFEAAEGTSMGQISVKHGQSTLGTALGCIAIYKELKGSCSRIVESGCFAPLLNSSCSDPATHFNLASYPLVVTY